MLFRIPFPQSCPLIFLRRSLGQVELPNIDLSSHAECESQILSACECISGPYSHNPLRCLVSRGRRFRSCSDLRPWSLRASCDFEANPKNRRRLATLFVCGPRSEKPSDFCSGMVAGPLPATVVTAILRCDFCAAKPRCPVQVWHGQRITLA